MTIENIPEFTWTDERVETLKCLLPGKSMSQIAIELGCSRNAVIGKVHRLAIQVGRKPKAKEPASPPPPPLNPKVEKRKSKLTRPTSSVLPIISVQHTPEVQQAMPLSDFIEPSRQKCFDLDKSAISIEDLKTFSCRWPLGLGEPFFYCGRKTEGLSKPYCRGHAALAYNPPAQRASRREPSS